MCATCRKSTLLQHAGLNTLPNFLLHDHALQLQAPVPVPTSVQEYVNEAKGGFVSIVVLPRHVKESTLDEFVWTLLSFHDHVQYHVKCFKVSAPGH